MQKWVLKIQNGFVLGLLLCSLQAAGNEQLLAKADSLYTQKKFTAANKVYSELYEKGVYTPATLLKMAFVCEGTGDTGKALYYLSAYYRVTEDSKAYEKIQTLANAKGVSGYDLTEMDRISIWASNRKSIYQPVLSCVTVFLVALMFYFNRKKQLNGKYVTGFFSMVTILALFASINFIESPNKAVVTTSSYFMSGPSSAANLIRVVPEGNQVKLGREVDIWVEAEWEDETGYIRKTDLLQNR